MTRVFSSKASDFDVNEKAVEHFRQYTFQENLVDYVKEAQKRTAAQTEYMKKVIDDTKNNKKLNEKADESVSPSNTNQTTKIESLNHDKCILCQIPHSEISYLNQSLLCYFIGQSGRILSKYETHTCSKHQRQIAKCIKQARQACIIPFLPDLDGTNNVEDQVEQKQ